MVMFLVFVCICYLKLENQRIYEKISILRFQNFILNKQAATGGVLQGKVLLEILQNSQENTCARVFFNKVADLRPATFLKKRLWHWCFLVNFAKFLRATFLMKNSGGLLLNKSEEVQRCIQNPVKRIIWSSLRK